MNTGDLEASRKAYRELVHKRLAAFEPRLREALAPLRDAALPAGATVGFEVFVAELEDRFPVHAYVIDHPDEPDHPATDALNATMERWPSVLHHGDEAPFVRWTTGPDGETDHADEQVWDDEPGETALIDMFARVWASLDLDGAVPRAFIRIHDGGPTTWLSGGPGA